MPAPPAAVGTPPNVLVLVTIVTGDVALLLAGRLFDVILVVVVTTVTATELVPESESEADADAGALEPLADSVIVAVTVTEMVVVPEEGVGETVVQIGGGPVSRTIRMIS